MDLNQSDHILTDRQRHSSVLDVGPLKAANCDTGHHLAVSKQTTHRFHVGRFNLMTLNEEEGKDQYSVEVSNRF
jgi:hypothetical protein